MDPWNCWGAAQVFAYASELSALGAPGVSRVLVTGGAGTIGAAVVRRLLADPGYEVRVSDQREAPQWMREGCEVHTGDLRVPAEAHAATRGCTHVIHLAAIVGGIANFHRLPHTLTEVNNALYNAVIRAALELEVERFVYVSSSMVFERAELFPTPEEYLPDCPVPLSAYGFSKLTGEVYCRAAHAEHGLPYTICRPFNAYGPGELPDAEPGIAHAVPGPDREGALGAAAAADLRLWRADPDADPRRGHRRRGGHRDELAGGAERGLQHLGLARAHGRGDRAVSSGRRAARTRTSSCSSTLPSFEVDVQRRWPSVEKARRLLGWEARIAVEDGIAATVGWLRERRARQTPTSV